MSGLELNDVSKRGPGTAFRNPFDLTTNDTANGRIRHKIVSHYRNLAVLKYKLLSVFIHLSLDSTLSFHTCKFKTEPRLLDIMYRYVDKEFAAIVPFTMNVVCGTPRNRLANGNALNVKDFETQKLIGVQKIGNLTAGRSPPPF